MEKLGKQRLKQPKMSLADYFEHTKNDNAPNLFLHTLF